MQLQMLHLRNCMAQRRNEKGAVSEVQDEEPAGNNEDKSNERRRAKKQHTQEFPESGVSAVALKSYLGWRKPKELFTQCVHKPEIGIA